MTRAPDSLTRTNQSKKMTMDGPTDRRLDETLPETSKFRNGFDALSRPLTIPRKESNTSNTQENYQNRCIKFIFLFLPGPFVSRPISFYGNYATGPPTGVLPIIIEGNRGFGTVLSTPVAQLITRPPRLAGADSGPATLSTTPRFLIGWPFPKQAALP